MPCLLNQAETLIWYLASLLRSSEILLDVSSKAHAFLLSFLKFRYSPRNSRRPLRNDSPLTNNDSFLDFVNIVKPDNQVAPVQPEFRAAAFDVTGSYPDRFLAFA